MAGKDRRFSFNWATAPDEGDAAAAAADLTTWMAEQNPRDWTGVLTKLRDQLTLLFINPLIRSDPEARRILESFADCEDFEAINRVCHRLGARVAVLLALRGQLQPRASDQGNASKPRPPRLQMRV